MRRTFIASALLACASAASAQRDTLVGPGVSAELARYRAATVSDVRYDLHLDVAKLDTAYGRVTISWIRQGSDDAIVDFRGRSLQLITVNGKRLPMTAFNGAHIRIPAAALVSGENSAT